jgi:hypothetical protein
LASETPVAIQLQNSLTDSSAEHVPFSSKPIRGSWPVSSHHEPNLLCQGVHVVFVCELGRWQELIPVVLFVACEDMGKLFELLVDVCSVWPLVHGW